MVPIEQLGAEVAAKLQSLLESVLTSSGIQRIAICESGFEAFTDTHSMTFRVKDHGEYNAVFARNKLAESPVNMTSEAHRGCRMIRSFLGSEWSVECLGESYVVHNATLNQLLLISVGK